MLVVKRSLWPSSNTCLRAAQQCVVYAWWCVSSRDTINRAVNIASALRAVPAAKSVTLYTASASSATTTT
eukprot:7464-Heterococcus_DN1.PRE.2